MCPNCRAFISTNDRVCPYCDAQIGPRAIDIRSADLLGVLPRANSSSVVFLVINVAAFLATLALNANLAGGFTTDFSVRVLVLLGAKYSPLILNDGQWWRLFTAGVLHGGLLHIAINSWSLFDLVAEVEQFYGTSRLIIAYIVSSVSGFLLSTLFSASVSVGASAACFGMIGVMLALGLRDRSNPLTIAIRAYYRRWAVYGLIFSLMPRIDLSAHVGGLAGGFVIGLLTGLPGRQGSVREQIWRVAAWLCVGVALYAFFQEFRFLAATLRSR